ncbi:MAG: thymidine phosphorylase, partial [Gammaproteobacteria bacterium]|nr:thymidine phosphorylase [Gammaproteobacteria bacterium]
TDIALDDFVSILERERFAMIGQTPEIAPLDRRLYDLRSVTGTVSSIPLIATSIMSKKLAEGLTGLVLDVKAGSGAFLPGIERALELARTMVTLGERAGVETVALVTAMDRPLGRAIGNALEVAEALDCLAGGGPADLREVTLGLVAQMMVVGGLARDAGSARTRASAALDSGRPLERFARVVALQGGDTRAVHRPERLPAARVRRYVRAQSSGFAAAIDPRTLGHGVVELGGGRTRLGATINRGVGFRLEVQVGEKVASGSTLGVVYAATSADADRASEMLRRAIRVAPDVPPPQTRLMSHRVTSTGVEQL